MKFLGVVLGVMVSTACSGDPGDSDDVVGTNDAASPFETLRGAGPACHPGHGGHGDHGARLQAIRSALGDGAARLAALQADTIGDNAGNGLVDTDPDDGGWDFIVAPTAASHSTAASPPNLFGAIGLAAWAAVTSGSAHNRALVVALDAGVAMQRNPDIDSPPDFIFGVLLAELAENPGFAQVAREHYDAKRAAAGGATGLGTQIRDGRHARNEDGLIAYDLGWLTLSAAALDSAFPGAGYAADADTYAGIVVDDVGSSAPRFDITNPAEGDYITGLAWSQVATAWLGADALFDRVRARLLGEQHADGAWGNNAADAADNLQSTAFALQTLALSGRGTLRTLQAGLRATRWLLAGQAASGGWPDAANHELPLVNADIMIGLMLSGTAAGQGGLVPGAAFAQAPAGLARTAEPASPSP